MVAVGKTPERSLERLRLPARPLLAILEGLEKPGNVGAIIRSADAAAVNAVIIADGQTDLFNPNTIRASLGTLFTTQVCAAPLTDVLPWLTKLHVPVCVARPDAEQTYDQIDYTHGAAIVLGSEAQGVSSGWSSIRRQAIRLPMLGDVDSLNVSATAAVLFYEAVRQRHHAAPATG
jgi:TrmH family RNA methyltransferase